MVDLDDYLKWLLRFINTTNEPWLAGQAKFVSRWSGELKPEIGPSREAADAAECSNR